MLDMKAFNIALDELENERKISKEKIWEAIEQALGAAYKKDYGKKGQIVRATLDPETGEARFSQIKIVVDESTVRILKDDEDEDQVVIEEGDERVRYNPEHHILLEDAKMIKSDAKIEDELIFPLETKEDFGRIAAQTAKQVIIQKIREAERESVISEYGAKEGEIVSGIVQKFERGTLYIDLGRAVGMIPYEEQIPGDRFNRGDRIKAYLFAVDESVRGVTLKLSRTHPKFVEALFSMEAPEVQSGTVVIKSIAREAGSRSKIAVYSSDEHVDPVGSCVGQKGIRVTTVMSELGNEKIDIIPWSENVSEFVASSLSPARVLNIDIDEQEHKAHVDVAEDQLSLAIGKGGQNVRLAAKLTGWKIDIKGIKSDEVTTSDGETVEVVGGEENADENISEEVVSENEESSEETKD
jgi:N utilization substance protein A